MRRATLVVAGSVLLGLAGTAMALSAGGEASRGEAQQPDTARAVLRDSAGQQVGVATLVQTPDGVLVRTELTNVPPGVHAFHVHEVGRCDPPSFQSAGGHYNPFGRQHGILNASGPHAGDMPNIHVPETRRLTFEVLIPRVTLGQGQATLFDANGSALVVHAGADDYRTDPAGNAGARIACGVVVR
jgi:Cu-Zn family superoxide dismutase